MTITPKAVEFLRQLADLCERFEASFGYTNDDDGTHITVGDEKAFVGYIDGADAASQLRAAADK